VNRQAKHSRSFTAPLIDTPSTNGAFEPLEDAAREVTAPRGVATARAQIFTTLAVIALFIFGGLTVLVAQGLTASTDLAVTLTVQSLTSPVVATLMIGVSWIGFLPQSILVVAVTATVLWLAGVRTESVFVLGAAASDILTEVIKHVVGRPRPGSELVHVIAGASSPSFPSGHTLFYVTFFGFLAFLAYARITRGWLRTSLLWLFGVLIVLVGPSRIWMGQHWASDVLASYTLGFAYLVALIQTYSWYRDGRGPARVQATVSSGES
jgi:undecaprenyl-diphosphatase